MCIVCEAGVGICSVHCPLGGIASALGRREVRGVASDSLLVAPKWLLPKQVSRGSGCVCGRGGGGGGGGGGGN